MNDLTKERCMEGIIVVRVNGVIDTAFYKVDQSDGYKLLVNGEEIEPDKFKELIRDHQRISTTDLPKELLCIADRYEKLKLITDMEE